MAVWFFFGLVLTLGLPQVLTPSGFLLGAYSKSGLDVDFQVISFYFIIVSVLFCLSCVDFGIRANTDLFEASLPSIQNQKNITHKKKKKKEKKNHSHVSSHQKVTHQPKPFDPTTNKPHHQTWSSSFKRFFTSHHPLESQLCHPNK